MNEVGFGIRTIIGIAGILPYSLFWMFGGRSKEELGKYKIPGSPRIWRRLVAPIYLYLFILIFSIICGSFSLWYLPSIIFLKWETHFGYGYNGGSIGGKILRRALWATLFSLSSLSLVWFSKNWITWGAQALITFIVAILFGVWNPFKKNEDTKDAPIEEAIISFMARVLAPFIP